MEKESKQEQKVEKEAAVEQKTVTPAKNKKTNTFFIKGAAIGVVVVAVLFVTTMAMGIYRYHWNNSVVTGVVNSLPFPVVSVDGSTVRYSEFLADLKALRQFAQAQSSISGDVFDVSDQQLKQVVLSQFINRELIKDALKKYDIEITAEDIEAEYQNILRQQGGEESVLIAQLEEVYGWDLEEFKDKIVKFGLMESKLSEQISKDKELGINKVARERAEAMLARIRSGESYEEIARKENDDLVSAENDGDIGFVQRGMLVPEFEEVAFGMNPGDVSDIVETDYGFHIIKFEERKETTDDTPEEIRVRNILVRTATLQEYLEDLREEAKIKYFIDTKDIPDLDN